MGRYAKGSRAARASHQRAAEELFSNKMIFRSAVQTLRFFRIPLPMNPLNTALLALALCAATASAALWKSDDFNCQINLPDSPSANEPTTWATLGSACAGTLFAAG